MLEPVDHIEKRELPTDPVWRRDVERRMKDLGVGQKELGRWVGAAQPTIHYLLMGVARSEYVERISVALGVDLPLMAKLEIAAKVLIDANDLDGIRAAILFAESRAQLTKRK